MLKNVEDKVIKIRKKDKSYKESNKYIEFDKVKELKPGDSFGEEELINKTKRNVSIRCTKRTELAVINQEIFEKVMETYEEHLFR
jgi:CRP-like cAMP-binding protein